MVTIKEYNYSDAVDVVNKLGGSLDESERVLLMDEGGEFIGAAVIGLNKTIVEIRQLLVKDRPFSYFDLLARSTLNLINLFVLPIMVRVKSDDYFKTFGFTCAEDGYMYIQSDKINFKGSICGR